MAHYKRGKCRRNCPRAIRGSMASWRKKNGLEPREEGVPAYAMTWHPYKHMMNSYPAWWDRLYHTKPFRAKSHQVEKSIINGCDPDDVEFPVWGKPHIYYW